MDLAGYLSMTCASVALARVSVARVEAGIQRQVTEDGDRRCAIAALVRHERLVQQQHSPRLGVGPRREPSLDRAEPVVGVVQQRRQLFPGRSEPGEPGHEAFQNGLLPGQVVERLERGERPAESRGQFPGPFSPQAVERGLAGEEPPRSQAVDLRVAALGGVGVPLEQVRECGVVHRIRPARREGVRGVEQHQRTVVLAPCPGRPRLLVPPHGVGRHGVPAVDLPVHLAGEFFEIPRGQDPPRGVLKHEAFSHAPPYASPVNASR